MHEAATWVADEIQRLRAMSYEQLLAQRDQPVHVIRVTSDGKEACLETEVFWDDRPDGNLRVFVSVWGGGRRFWNAARTYAKDDFIRAPDGSFVDE